ncbi:fluoride efflux transporter FluC [Millisia brevis]|uniref:fluoride efflux transporter FluC n=1 Tax=Millisia brevis TaxID=264148 RepID=UPI000B1447D9|nr:CrcB family protein [Millisia brevis]
MVTGDADRPIDPDPDEPDIERPLHLRPSSILLVAAGGTVGTGIREALSLRFPAVDAIPYTIGMINIVGAFLLGLLLESLARSGPDEGIRRRMRLLLGTGVMGGFTTYSTFALDTAHLFGAARPGAAIAYALVTVIVGAAATVCGIATAVLVGRRGHGGAR